MNPILKERCDLMLKALLVELKKQDPKSKIVMREVEGEYKTAFRIFCNEIEMGVRVDAFVSRSELTSSWRRPEHDPATQPLKLLLRSVNDAVTYKSRKKQRTWNQDGGKEINLSKVAAVCLEYAKERQVAMSDGVAMAALQKTKKRMVTHLQALIKSRPELGPEGRIPAHVTYDYREKSEEITLTFTVTTDMQDMAELIINAAALCART